MVDAQRGTRGFTMVELLVVIVIIGILASIALTLAAGVTQGGKKTLSESVIRSMDEVLAMHQSETDEPTSLYANTVEVQANRGADEDVLVQDEAWAFPLVDGRYVDRSFDAATQYDRDLDPVQPTVALLLAGMGDANKRQSILQAFDSRLVKHQDVFAYGWENQFGGFGSGPTGNLESVRLRLPVILDGFGEPLRMVHPAADGGWGDYYRGTGPSGTLVSRENLRVRPPGPSRSTFTQWSRSFRPIDEDNAGDNAYNLVGDADEGLCVGKSPYFYSAGADRDAGKREDNVYSVRPQFPRDTADLE